jgi:hypothetical protein
MADIRLEDGKYIAREVMNHVDLPLEGLPLSEVVAELSDHGGYENIRLTAGYYTYRDGDATGDSYIEAEGDRPARDYEITQYEEMMARRRAQEAEAEADRLKCEQALAEASDQAALKRAREAFPELFRTAEELATNG